MPTNLKLPPTQLTLQHKAQSQKSPILVNNNQHLNTVQGGIA
ncbi:MULTISPECIES: hypothetical protein [unclassified Calothrix]|nr:MULTISPECIES: hypothetical protein [unclassified Calothrix]